MHSIRTSIGYGSSLNKAFTVDGHVMGFKTHDYHNFMKVFESINYYCYHLLTYYYNYDKSILMNSSKWV